MKNISAAFWVGLLTIAAIAAFMYTYGRIEGKYSGGDDTYAVYALFDNVTGLAVRSTVDMAGVPIGFVEDISLDPDTSMAKVTVRIKKTVLLHEGVLDPKTEVYVNGATIERVQSSFIGDFHLSLSTGVVGPMLADGDRIPNAISETGITAALQEIREVTKIFPKIDRIVTDVGRITSAASEAYGGDVGVERFESIGRDMQQTAENIRTISDDIRGFVQQRMDVYGDAAERIVGNVERFTESAVRLSSLAEGRAGHILEDIQSVSRDLRGLIGGSREDVAAAAAAARRLLEGLERTAGGANDALADVGGIAKKINEGEGTIGRLINDDALVNNVEEIVDDAGDFVRRVTSLQAVVGLRSEYNFRASSLKTYVSIRLVPKEDKFYLIEVIDDPRGATSFIDRTTISNDPLQPPVLRESIAETSNNLKFSMEFGKRWYFLTGRFGIIESTGGTGLDFEFFEDTLKLSFDVFDFQADTYPRLKWLFSYEFIKHVYLAGGVDDIINDVGRDYFVGLGIRFTDDDLKSILTFGGIPSVGR